MPNIVRIKRRGTGGAAGAPSSLENAELAFNEVDDILYYGKGTGGAGGTASTILAIGGPGFAVQLSGSYANPAWITSLAGSKITGNIGGNAANVTGTVALANGGTGAPDAATARTNLGLAIGSNVQAWDGDLDAIAALAGTSGLLRKTAANTWSLDTNSYLTGNQNITFTGDATGSGTTSVALTLANSGVTAGTYGSSSAVPVVTVDAKGRITTVSTAAISGSLSFTGDVTGTGTTGTTTTMTLANSGVTAGTYGSATASAVVTVDAKGRVTSASSTTVTPAWSSITSRPTTIAGFGITDAYTRTEVDSLLQGLDPKQSVRVATTANITLSGTQTIDGVAVIAGDRVLVKDQTTASQNGIYVVAAGAWARSTDADAWTELPGAYVFAEEGTVNAEIGFVCTVNAGGTIGTTAVTWQQFSGAGQITAGAGMTKTGNTLDIGTASSARIVVNADNIDLATTGVTPGSYQLCTVDSYGRVTAGSNPTTLAGFGITDAQPLDATLTALAGVTTAANSLIYATAADVFTTTTLSAFGRSLIDDADAATGRTTLGLGTMATQASNSVSITGGSIDNITIDGGTF